MTNGFGSFSVGILFNFGESAQDYLTSNAYTPFNGSKIVYRPLSLILKNDPTNQGCAFILLRNSQAIILLQRNGKSIDCHVNTSDSLDLLKNVLVVNVTS